jgi:hypothetical protein
MKGKKRLIVCANHSKFMLVAQPVFVFVFGGGDTAGDAVVIVVLLWNMTLDALSNDFQPGERSDGRSWGGAGDDYRTDSRRGLFRQKIPI